MIETSSDFLTFGVASHNATVDGRTNGQWDQVTYLPSANMLDLGSPCWPMHTIAKPDLNSFYR